MENRDLSPELTLLARRWTKNFMLIWLSGLILVAGAYTDLIFPALDRIILKLVVALDLTGLYQALVHSSHSKITMQRLPTMLAYGLGYCLLCLLTLYVYFGRTQKFFFALLFYTGVFALCACLIVLGKALGDLVPMYNLARRLIEMIVSPFPVVLLVCAFSFRKSWMKVKGT